VELAYARALCRTIPRLIVDAALAAPDTADVVSQRFEGVVLHIDVVGFTSISERLAAAGDAGLAQLSRGIDAVLRMLLDEALLPGGGDAVQFGGDSATVVFRGPSAAHRAAAAALAARDQLPATLQGALGDGARDLSFRTGIASGQIRITVIGDRDQRLAVCAGAPSHRAVQLQASAAPGTVRVCAATAAALAEVATLGPCPDDAEAREVEALRTPPPPPPPATPAELSPAVIARLEPFVPAPLAARLRVTPSGWRIDGELRQVIVMFVEVIGMDDQGATDQHSLAPLLRIVRRHGGITAKADVTGDGHRVLVLFGLHTPSAADAESALSAGLEIAATLKTTLGRPGFALAMKTGVHAGRAYFGSLGSEHRHDITVLGDVVNTAARVAHAAEPFRVLATEAVLAQADGRFSTKPCPAVRAKGKAEPLAVAELVAPTEDVAHYVQLRRRRQFLAGRDDALAALRGFIDQGAAAGPARARAVAGICGQAGTGKSALLSVIIDDWTAAGGLGMVARCRAANRARPLAPIAAMLTTMLGLTREGDHDERRLRVVARLRALARTSLPELAQLLIEDSAGSGLDVGDDAVRERVLGQLVGLLGARGESGPMLFVLEDLHLADPLTRALAARLAQATPAEFPHPVLVTFQPDAALAGLRRALAVEVEVSNLAPPAATALVRHELGAAAIEPPLLEFLLRRTEGNPAHLVDVIRFLRERELLAVRAGVVVAPAGGVGLLEDVVPRSAAHVALARLDELGGVERRLLRAASVLGAAFSQGMLAHAVGQELDLQQISAALDALTHRRLLAVEPGAAMLAFRDDVTRAVAYASIPAEQRRAIHRRIAEALEKRPDGDPARDAATLALHRERAGDFALAAAGYLRAAPLALAAGLDEDAAQLATRWAACIDALGEPAAAARAADPAAAARMALIQVVALGRRRLASDTVARAEQALREHGDHLGDADRLVIEFWLGTSLAWLGKPQLAQGHLARVVEHASHPPLRCEAAMRIAQTHDYARDRAAAIVWLARAAELADGDPRLLAEVELHRTNLEDAPAALEPSRATYRRIQAGASERGQLQLAARAANCAAHCDLHLRQFADARLGFQQAIALNRATGNWLDVATNLSNLGQALLWDGQAAAAVAPLEEALRHAQESEDQLAVAEVMVHLGAAIGLTSDPIEGLALCTLGGARAAEAGLREAELAHLLLLAELALRAGEPTRIDAAIARCDQVADEFATPLLAHAYAALRRRAGTRPGG
jgi:class 3 adenylate cyclase/tetratricopeptide (TPR) repeat protein